jgi:hypothetical protein
LIASAQAIINTNSAAIGRNRRTHWILDKVGFLTKEDDMLLRSPRGQCLLFAMVVALLVTPMAFGHIPTYPTESDTKMPLRPTPLVTLKPADVPASASPSADANAKTDQEVLKINEACNAAELRADISAMDSCETEDFTHTHANGMVEHKAEYLKGVGSGAHKFLLLDLSDLHVRSYGTSAIVEGRIHLRANNSGKIADVNNHLMVVWVKQQGKWREAAWFAVGLPASGATAVSEK